MAKKNNLYINIKDDNAQLAKLADFLRDGIYELRASHRRVQYRILYFFHGRNIAIIAHAIVKEGSAVPNVDINRAIERQQLFITDTVNHTYEEERSNGEN